MSRGLMACATAALILLAAPPARAAADDGGRDGAATTLVPAEQPPSEGGGGDGCPTDEQRRLGQSPGGLPWGRYFAYDHRAGTPCGHSPFPLKVGHGDFFQVAIVNTDPRYFNYEVTAIPVEDGRPDSAGQRVTNKAVETDQLSRLDLPPLRHDRHIRRYRVTISLTENVASVQTRAPATPEAGTRRFTTGERLPAGVGAPPQLTTYQLRPVAFDVAVETSGPELIFNGGFVFSGLRDRKYFINKQGNVEASTDARDAYEPDAVLLASLLWPRGPGSLGVSIGLGSTTQRAARYYVGASYLLGKQFVFNGGIALGDTAALPAGQKENEPPMAGADTLKSLPRRLGVSWYVGFAFAFDNRKEQFLNQLTSRVKASAPPPAAQPAGVPGTPDASTFVGQYLEDDDTLWRVSPNLGVETLGPDTIAWEPVGALTPDGRRLALIAGGELAVSAGAMKEAEVVSLTMPQLKGKPVLLSRAAQPVVQSLEGRFVADGHAAEIVGNTMTFRSAESGKSQALTLIHWNGALYRVGKDRPDGMLHVLDTANAAPTRMALKWGQTDTILTAEPQLTTGDADGTYATADRKLEAQVKAGQLTLPKAWLAAGTAAALTCEAKDGLLECSFKAGDTAGTATFVRHSRSAIWLTLTFGDRAAAFKR